MDKKKQHKWGKGRALNSSSRASNADAKSPYNTAYKFSSIGPFVVGIAVVLVSAIVALYLLRSVEMPGLSTTTSTIPTRYCPANIDCKLIWTRQGFVEYALIQGSGPTVALFHGAPGGIDQSLQIAQLMFPPRKEPPLLPSKSSPPSTSTPPSQQSESPVPAPLPVSLPPYNLLVFSRPGYLGTPLQNEGSSLAQQSDLLTALLDELDIDNVAVIGLNGGALYALDYAQREEKRCWGAVAVGGWPPVPYAHWSVDAFALLHGWLPRFLNSYVHGYVDLLLRSNWTLIGGTDRHTAKFLSSTTSHFDQRSHGYANDRAQFAQITNSMDDFTSAINIPTLIISDTNVKTRHKHLHIDNVSPASLPYHGDRIRAIGRKIDQFFEQNSEFLVYSPPM